MQSACVTQVNVVCVQSVFQTECRQRRGYLVWAVSILVAFWCSRRSKSCQIARERILRRVNRREGCIMQYVSGRKAKTNLFFNKVSHMQTKKNPKELDLCREFGLQRCDLGLNVHHNTCTTYQHDQSMRSRTMTRTHTSKTLPNSAPFPRPRLENNSVRK